MYTPALGWKYHLERAFLRFLQLEFVGSDHSGTSDSDCQTGLAKRGCAALSSSAKVTC